MKAIKTLIALFLLLYCARTFAQEPQQIKGIAKEVHTAEYYEQQSDLWKKETQKASKNANAWYNRYRAQRAYLQKSQPEVWVTNQPVILEQLIPIIKEAKKAVGNSFEYYLMESENTRTAASIEYLKKAHAVAPERTEAYEGLLVHYVSVSDKSKAGEIARKMLACNYYSNANLKWNFNALQTTVKDAVFITHGDMDAIPKWVLQYGAGIRTDVLVASKWLMAFEPEYKETVFETVGAKAFSKTKDDFEHAGAYVAASTAYLVKNSKRAVYMGCGTDVKFFECFDLTEHMYLVGMAFRYSTEGFDNLGTTIKNFEKKYDLEYLLNNFQHHSEDDVVKKQMNLTYIPGLMKLKKHYKAAGNIQKEQYYQQLIERIAEDSGRAQEIIAWYE